MADRDFKTFKEFYPYYLSEHSLIGTRVTHFIGTSLFLIFAMSALLELKILFLIEGIFCAYLFAWIGHFFIEKNKPATFQYPWMSLKGDFKLYFDILTGKQGFKGQ